MGSRSGCVECWDLAGPTLSGDGEGVLDGGIEFSNAERLLEESVWAAGIEASLGGVAAHQDRGGGRLVLAS